MNVHFGMDRPNAVQPMTITYVTEVSLGYWKELAKSFTWAIFSPPWTYLMTSTQELSSTVELSDRIIKECRGTNHKTLKLKWVDTCKRGCCLDSNDW
jgi:hypothetical protein